MEDLGRKSMFQYRVPTNARKEEISGKERGMDNLLTNKPTPYQRVLFHLRVLVKVSGVVPRILRKTRKTRKGK